MTFLRVVLICVLVFFAGAAIYRWTHPNIPPDIQKIINKVEDNHHQQQPGPQTGQPGQQPPSKQPDNHVIYDPTENGRHPTKTPVTQPTTSQEPQTADEPAYKIIPVAATSGLPDNLTVTMQQCRRSGEAIRCSGIARNKDEIAKELQLKDSRATDDEGRSFAINGGDISFDTGQNLKLQPSVPVRFSLKIDDPYPRVKSVNLVVHVYFGDEFNPLGGSKGGYADIVFKDVPVQ